MWRDRLREVSARTEPTGGAQGGEEAILERYIEQPSRLRDWLEARIRQAPWWSISFLVHVIALVVLWHWPVETGAILADDPTKFERPVVEIYNKPELERPAPPPKERPEAPKPDTHVATEPGKLSDLEPPKMVGPRAPEPPQEMPRGPEDPSPVQAPAPPIIAVQNHGPLPPPGSGDPWSKRRWVALQPSGDGDRRGDGPGDGQLRMPLLEALRWLARAQEADGSWDAKRWDGASPYRVGMTGLALLAFAGVGCTHEKGDFHTVVAKGLDWLRKSQAQRADGSFPWETFYEQGIATMAVCELYGMTGDERLRPMAQRAINCIVRLQPDHGGFRYAGPVPQDQGDMSVTGWQIMAIKSALLAKLDVPPQALDRSRVFLKNSWRDYGGSAYLVGDKGAGSLAVSAIGLLCRVFLSERGEYADEVRQAANLLYSRETQDFRTPPGGASKELVNDLYYTYYSSLAMFQLQGEYWRAWKTMYMEPLVALQVKNSLDARGRYVKGSWEPTGIRWADRGGRVYSTAMAALCLEAPFRFLPLYRARQ